MFKAFWILFLLLLLTSCGYKPTSIYTKKVLGNKIYASVEVSLEDPENSVLIRDAVNEAIINKFRAELVPKTEATSKLFVKLNSVSFSPLEYDRNGYVVAYKTKVILLSRYIDRNSKENTIRSFGDYDFSIESNSIISDIKRFDAIKRASQKALDVLISQISIKGVNYDHQ